MMNVCGPSDGAEERIVGVRKRKKKRKGQITEEIAMGREACLLGSCEIGETRGAKEDKRQPCPSTSALDRNKI